MIISLATEENGGLSFNKRALSLDRVVDEDILARSGGTFFTAAFSKDGLRLFIKEKGASEQDGDNEEKVFDCVSASFVSDVMSHVGDKELFIVNPLEATYPLMASAKRIIVYNWGRRYPCDIRLRWQFLPTFREVETRELKGFSHEEMTVTTYERTDF